MFLFVIAIGYNWSDKNDCKKMQISIKDIIQPPTNDDDDDDDEVLNLNSDINIIIDIYNIYLLYGLVYGL